MERFEICVPSPDAPLVIVVAVIPAADAGWLEGLMLSAVWEGRPPYQVLRWLPDLLEGYGDEVEFWPDMAGWRWQDHGHAVNVNAYRAIVRPGR